MDRRRSLLAASQPTFNGNELPTEIPLSSLPTEELQNLFSFLSSLTINGYPVQTIYIYADNIQISTQYTHTTLYQDGSTISGGSEGN